MTPVRLEHTCAVCRRPIVVGRLLPWTHAAGRIGNPHYARPLRAPAMSSPTTAVTPRAGAAGVELIAGSRRRELVSPGD